MATSSSTLMVRLDEASKASVAKAAKLRHISISDYVRSVIVTQAEKELQEAEQRGIALRPMSNSRSGMRSMSRRC